MVRVVRGGERVEVTDRELNSKPRTTNLNLFQMKVEKNNNKTGTCKMAFLFEVNNGDILIKGFPFWSGVNFLFSSFLLDLIKALCRRKCSKMRLPVNDLKNRGFSEAYPFNVNLRDCAHSFPKKQQCLWWFYIRSMLNGPFKQVSVNKLKIRMWNNFFIKKFTIYKFITKYIFYFITKKCYTFMSCTQMVCTSIKYNCYFLNLNPMSGSWEKGKYVENVKFQEIADQYNQITHI